MNCKKCGNPLEENDQFCKNCGAPVKEVSAQTNYGPAPKNSTLKFVLIFFGIAIIVAAIIIAIAIFAGDKDDDDVKTSKKKTQIVSKDDEDEDEEIKDKNEDKEEDEVVVKPTTNTSKSTYTVKSGGFIFKIPIDLVYETDEDGSVAIGDEDETWMATITPIQGSYNQLLTNKNQIQSNMIKEGYAASAAVEKTYEGVSFVTVEVSISGQNMLIAYTKANSMYFFGLSALSINNEFDYDILEELAGVVSTAEFNSETTNLEAVKGLDLSVISDLAKE